MICRYQRLILFRTEGFERERTEGTGQKYWPLYPLIQKTKHYEDRPVLFELVHSSYN
jgi:hypothetical protein